jgi:hypothetical protein
MHLFHWKLLPGVGSSDALCVCVVLAQLIDGWNNGLKPFRLHLQIRPTTRINTSQWGSATSFTLLSALAGNSGGNYPTLKGTASQRMAGKGGCKDILLLKGLHHKTNYKKENELNGSARATILWRIFMCMSDVLLESYSVASVTLN